ncbi:hypothetical protein R1sor_000958 [Riccia sorocarpa]|uniref:HAT C-terminal dimerisation domain-containing protein n=1 Tax=Riccia sorocarpa TaxID=122646 RepID=A0ABD3GWK6_9MARC
MKTENVEAGPSGPDAGLPQPRDEARKFTIKHYVVLPDQKPGNPRIRCRYCPFEINHNITRMKHHLTGLKAAPPKASTALNKKGEKNQQTCQFVPVVVREELTRLMSVQERKSGVEGEHYKACKVEPDEGDLRSSQAASPSPGFSSNPDLGQGSMEYNRALRDRSASRIPTSSLLGGPESAFGLSSLEPERRMPSKNDIRYPEEDAHQCEVEVSTTDAGTVRAVSVNAHARWEMWNNKLHPTTMLLMSFYFTKPNALPYLQIEHVKQSFRRYVRIYGTHVLKKQLDEIEEYVEKCMDDLTLVLGGDHRIINHENSVKLAEKYKDEPHRWYIVYGDGIPAMRDLAMQILGQSVTSSACERNWSSFSHIHNKKRNRLTVERVDKLVYVAFNKNISSIHRKLERQGAKTLNKYLRSRGKQQKIRRFVDEYEEPTKFGCDLSKWLDDQAEDNEVRGRTEAPAFAGETSEPHTDQSQERQRPKKFEDDIDDDDLCSEEGDVESEDDCLIDVLLREQVRFDNGSASVRPGHNERLVTVEDIAYDETISISLPKVEVEQAVSKPEYGRLIGKMWEKFAAPAPAKQPVAKRAKVSASNPNVPLVTCSNLKPKDLPASSSGQAILNYPPSHGGRYRPDSPQVSSQAGASSPTLSGNGEKRQSTKNKPPVSYKAFLG